MFCFLEGKSQSKFSKVIFSQTLQIKQENRCVFTARTKHAVVEDTSSMTLHLQESSFVFASAFSKPYDEELEPVEKVLRNVLPRAEKWCAKHFKYGL